LGHINSSCAEEEIITNMICKKCGSEIPNGVISSKECVACGAPLDEQSTQEQAIIRSGEVVAAPAVAPAEHGTFLAPASITKRFTNNFVDGLVTMFFVLGIGVIMGLSGMEIDEESPMWDVIGIVFFALFYLVFEATTQRTPAKYITHTKVVRKDGGKPTFGQILGRSFARFIPFEALTFLTGSYPVGWHDKLSGTMVVPSDYTEEDVKNIDVPFANSQSKKHFYFVVIAICIFIVVFGILLTGIMF
jgi:uncharacterized RDD family membrane protein YckC